MKPAVPVPEAPEATPAAAEVDAVEAADDDQSAGSRAGSGRRELGCTTGQARPGPGQAGDQPRFRRRGEGRDSEAQLQTLCSCRSSRGQRAGPSEASIQVVSVFGGWERSKVVLEGQVW